MGHPRTYMLTAPHTDFGSEFGTAMSSINLVAGLKRIEPRLCVPPSCGVVYIAPKPVDGITGLWFGSPYMGGRFLVAFHEGMVPEYTMIERGTGKIFKRGWRAIFEKLIADKVVQRGAVEREFRVTLQYDGASGMCRDCQRRGYRVTATCMNEYCDDCFDNRMMLAQAKEHRREAKWLREHPEPPNPGRVQLDLGS